MENMIGEKKGNLPTRCLSRRHCVHFRICLCRRRAGPAVGVPVLLAPGDDELAVGEVWDIEDVELLAPLTVSDILFYSLYQITVC